MKKILLLLIATCAMINLKAQETEAPQNATQVYVDSIGTALQNTIDDINVLKRLKITGYIQPQWQMAQSDGVASFAGGNFGPDINNRFTMRRGRVKFTYELGMAMYMLNTDWTERGVAIRETYVKLTEPSKQFLQLSMGLRQYQFGHDLNYSSGDRETPERARMFQILFPTERDMQAIVTWQPPKTHPLNWLKFDLAACNGSGVAAEFDKFKDITGRVSIARANASESMKIGVGLSFLTGGYKQGVMSVSRLQSESGGYVFKAVTDSSNIKAKAPRNYIGADVQITNDFPFGINIFRAEYIQGVQTGTASSTTSPNILPTSALYVRNFRGFSAYLIQTIKESNWQAILKYDFYDPNTKVAGTDIGKTTNGTKAADILYSTWGIGLNFRPMENVRMMAYYDKVTNENTTLKGFTEDIKDDVFTFRIQYKF